MSSSPASGLMTLEILLDDACDGPGDPCGRIRVEHLHQHEAGCGDEPTDKPLSEITFPMEE